VSGQNHDSLLFLVGLVLVTDFTSVVPLVLKVFYLLIDGSSGYEFGAGVNIKEDAVSEELALSFVSRPHL
jgi:hypothetical protein